MLPRLLNIPRNNSCLLLGPRGTGKSTLIRSSLEKLGMETLWIDLLQPEQEETYLRNPGLLRERILGENAKTVVIDEVQKVPALLDVAHELIESKGVIFILTGSSARKLKRGGANLLAGRAFALHLDAFSAKELGDRFTLQEALEMGLLPRIYFPYQGKESPGWEREEKIAFLQTYARTYLKEEIQLEQYVRKIQPFRHFLEIAAQMNGKVVEYSNLAKDTGVDHKTIAEYFQILEDTLVGFFLLPYHRSFRKTQGKKPKFYFFDPGIKRALDRTLTVPLLPQTSAYGEAFEHLVILELRKLAQISNPDIRLSFFRTHDGAQEIDLIIERPGKPVCLVEIKSSSSVRDTEISKLARYAEDFESPALFILCQETAPREKDGVRILPWRQGIDEILYDSSAPGDAIKKIHPWRLCPAGQHWTKDHAVHIAPSRKNPVGSRVPRSGHCTKNPSGKDRMVPLEMAEIARNHFTSATNKPCALDLGYGNAGKQFDDFIAGWVQYWNDVLTPATPLDANLVKALIATESEFKPKLLAIPKNSNSARGLMQITNSSRRILGDEKGELKDHFVIATKAELNDPNVNVCAGIRWLFYKQRMASHKLGRTASWIEAVYEYKGAVKGNKKERKKIMDIFNDKYVTLQKCKK